MRVRDERGFVSSLTEPGFAGTAGPAPSRIFSPSNTLRYAVCVCLLMASCLGGYAAPSQLLLGASSVQFQAAESGATPAPQSVLVASSGNALAYGLSIGYVSPSEGWLSVVDAGPGVTPSQVKLSVNPRNLDAGVHMGYVRLSGGSAVASYVMVTLKVGGSTVVDGGALSPSVMASAASSRRQASRKRIIFDYQIGASAPVRQRLLTSTKFGRLGFSAKASADWIRLSGAAGEGAAPGSFEVTADPAGLSPGSYEGEVTVTDAESHQEIVPVNLNVGAGAFVTAEPRSLRIKWAPGQPAPAPLTIDLHGEGPLNVRTSSGSSNWLAFGTSAATASSKTVTVAIDPSQLAEGHHSAAILVESGNGATTPIPIDIDLDGPNAGINVDVTDLNFQVNVGGARQSRNVSVTSTLGAEDFRVNVRAAPAGLVTTSVDFSTAPKQVTVTVDPSVLSLPGTYGGIVQFIGLPTQEEADVNVSIAAAAGSGGGSLTATPSSLTYSQTVGGTAASSQTVQIGGSGAISTSSNASWLTVTPATATAPTTLTVSVNSAGLAAGSQQGIITVTGTGSPLSIPVTFNLTGPAVLTATPSSLSFNYVLGGNAPATQTAQITSGGGSTSVTASSTSTWLTVSPASGSTPATFTVGINPQGLAAGTYNGTVNVSAGGSPTPVAVTLVVTTTAVLNASPSTLNFSQQIGAAAPSPQTVQISIGNGSSTLSIASNAAWLSVTPTSATTPATITVSASAGALPAGTYRGVVTATAATMSIDIPVSLTVSTSAPALTVAPTTLSFSQTLGGTTPAPQVVHVDSSNGAATITATPSAQWLSVTPSSATTPANLTIAVTAAGLAAGNYQGSIAVVAGSSSINIQVGFTVSNPTSPTTVTPTSLSFVQIIGSPAPPSKSLRVDNANTTTFTVSTSVPWLTVTPTSSYTRANLTVSADGSGLPAGTYPGTITIDTGAGTVIVPVTFTIATTPPVISLSSASLSYSYTIGSGSPAPQTVHVDKVDIPVLYTAVSTVSWIIVRQNAQAAPSDFTVYVTPGTLPEGTFQSDVVITAGPTTVLMPVILTVSSGASSLSVTPVSLTFSQTVGGAAPAAQAIKVENPAAVTNFIASSNSPWLTVTPAAGPTPSTLTVSVNTTGLAAGPYQGTITISSGATSLTVAVTLTISLPNTTFLIQPASLVFSAPLNGTPPAAQPIAISSPGAPFSFSATPSTVDKGTWLTVSQGSGTTPATISVLVSPQGLPAGQYIGSILIKPNDAALTAQVISVAFTVAAPVTGGTGGPTATVRAIVNAASLQPGPVSPGELVSIFGSTLGPVAGVPATVLSSGAVSTAIGDTKVMFDGIASPLLYVRGDQINAIVPYSVYGRFATNMQVEVAGVKSDNLYLRVGDAAPGLFTVDGTGTGQTAVVNQDGTVNSPVFPAARNSVIAIYGTGEGQTRPAGQDGRIITTDVRPPLAAVSVRIGGVTAPVQYMGSAPGQVSGVFQLNVQVPATVVPGGRLPLEITIGGVLSQLGATVAVK